MVKTLENIILENGFFYCSSGFKLVYKDSNGKNVTHSIFDLDFYFNLLSKKQDAKEYIKQLAAKYSKEYNRSFFIVSCESIYFDAEILTDEDFFLFEAAYINKWLLPIGKNLEYKVLKSSKGIDLYKFKRSTEIVGKNQVFNYATNTVKQTITEVTTFDRTNEYLSETVLFNKGTTTLKKARSKEKFVSQSELKTTVQSMVAANYSPTKIKKFIAQNLGVENNHEFNGKKASRKFIAKFYKLCTTL
jgi:hypothetical protein